MTGGNSNNSNSFTKPPEDMKDVVTRFFQQQHERQKENKKHNNNNSTNAGISASKLLLQGKNYNQNRTLDLRQYRIPKQDEEEGKKKEDATSRKDSNTQRNNSNNMQQGNRKEIPLTETIRLMQHTFAEKRRNSQANNNNNNNSQVNSNNNNNNNHRSRKVFNTKGHKSMIQLQPLQSNNNNNKNNSTKSSSQQASILIPSHSLSLSEASLLFRQRRQVIQQLLKDLLNIQEQEEENLRIDPETLEYLAVEFNIPYRTTNDHSSENDGASTTTDNEAIRMRRRHEDTSSVQTTRPPVVCIMGHVDHGKTTLMDSLRRRAGGANQMSSKNSNPKKKKGNDKKSKNNDNNDSNIAGTEAGGITQVISAFQVPCFSSDDQEDNSRNVVTFLDTPGHAAFTQMRQSGSDAADMIVLVVAADDGVSPQTIEIIRSYQSIVEQTKKDDGTGSISMIVALNKIDKPGIDLKQARRKIENQLLEHGILVEGMPTTEGGDFGAPVQMVPVSGLTEEGLDDLIEAIALQSEVMDLRADDTARAEGVVMDARVDKGLGIVADCIIRWGSLSKGDVVVSGTHYGKVRLLKDVNGNQLKTGTPSQPVRLVGFDSVPKAGDPFTCVASEAEAVELVETRKAKLELAKRDADDDGENSNGLNENVELQSAGKNLMNRRWKENLEEKYGLDSSTNNSSEQPRKIRIPIIVKANADGSLAAIRDCLVAMGEESTLDIVIDPIKEGVGPVTKTEVQMAKDCNASIFCFNLKNDQTITAFANDLDVSIRQNDVIYRLLEDAKDEFANFLPPREVETTHGRAKVQAVFDIGGNKVAGLQVLSGSLYREKVSKNTPVHYRVLRDDDLVSETAFLASSLKHFKEDVDEIESGKECGLSLANFNDFEVGDVVECFSTALKHEFV